ncbi:hypothetical protein Ahy_A02g007700 isoform C [Arachis hypogaea]|uniref:Uncharacterized protein n=1 Tax=Arachis hypogaea TaxID=3818 RepID=A0A445EDD4_ARAHY|nr:hypothetical protein Ahy_A02g007700 isoform C [Arachis hypogaea]
MWRPRQSLLRFLWIQPLLRIWRRKPRQAPADARLAKSVLD